MDAKKSSKENAAKPKNTVILHQYGRSAHCPSVCPFCHKLETYLRVAKVPYVNVFSMEKSAKGKMPWIEYNGEVVADSQFCVDFINERCHVNLNADLNDEQLGISQAFLRLTEESLVWAMKMDLMVYQTNPKWLSDNGISEEVARLYKEKVTASSKVVGIGNHSQEEVYKINTDDLRSISRFLGKKKFMFGDKITEVDCILFTVLCQLRYAMYGSMASKLMDGTKKFMFGDKITEVDCIVFAMLCQLRYTMYGSMYSNIMDGELKNLSGYIERMKKDVWPDWKECCTMEAEGSKPENPDYRGVVGLKSK